MAQQAQVTSVEAVEAFRASLIIFLTKARATLDEVSHEAVHTQAWLQSEVRVCKRRLERAQQDLFNAMLSDPANTGMAQEIVVQKAKSAIAAAEKKLSALKKWNRELDVHAGPLVKVVDNLHSFLTLEMTRAVAHLGQVVTALDAYAGVAPPKSPGAGLRAEGKEKSA